MTPRELNQAFYKGEIVLLNGVPHRINDYSVSTGATDITYGFEARSLDLTLKTAANGLTKQQLARLDIVRHANLQESSNTAQEQPLISADEARKLGAGNAEFLNEEGDWIVCDGCAYIENYYKYRAIKPEQVKPAENLVKLNGKLMSREDVIAEWESKKGTHDLFTIAKYMSTWVIIDTPLWLPSVDNGSEYELRERPLKQISWKDVPAG